MSDWCHGVRRADRKPPGCGLINIPDARDPSLFAIITILFILESIKQNKAGTLRNIADLKSCLHCCFPLETHKTSTPRILKNTFFMYWNNKHTFGNNFIIQQIPSSHYFCTHIFFWRMENGMRARSEAKETFADVNCRRGTLNIIWIIK